MNKIIGVIHNEELVFLKEKDIYFIEKVNRITHIHTETKVFKTRKSLDYYEEKFRGSAFFRSHRSCLVNLSKVEKCVPQINYAYDIHFDDINEFVPVSRDRIKVLKKLLDV